MPREAIFVDTGAWISLLSTNDEHHVRAVKILAALLSDNRLLVTTQAVVLEVGDGLSVARRRHFAPAFRALLASPSVEVVSVDYPLLDFAWNLFLSRRDKEWSLTDCVSFVVMQERELLEAFAHDHHFEQAGFRALLREPKT